MYSTLLYMYNMYCGFLKIYDGSEIKELVHENGDVKFKFEKHLLQINRKVNYKILFQYNFSECFKTLCDTLIFMEAEGNL